MIRMPRGRALDALLDLIFAPVCVACGARIPTPLPDRLVCALCRSRLRAVPSPICDRCGAPRLFTGRDTELCLECREWPAVLRSARSACVLESPADELVYALKYKGWKALAEPLAVIMSRVVCPADVQREARVVVPVPTTRQRERVRGYNQAALLARAYAHSTARDFQQLLVRTTGSSQTALQPAERGANVASAFHLTRSAPSLNGAHVLLVDDVLTTGATALECARALAAGGARSVSVITFARALPRRAAL